jgi:hypothetical protein
MADFDDDSFIFHQMTTSLLICGFTRTPRSRMEDDLCARYAAIIGRHFPELLPHTPRSRYYEDGSRLDARAIILA